MTHTFYIVDVFAESKYAGNQLAVIRDAQNLSTDEMQKIAREMHFSETTFILNNTPHDGGYDVRIFTIETELPFAGHPTLGTAYIIRKEIIQDEVALVTLNLKVGKIPVTFSGDILWMKQIPPTFGATVEPEIIAQTLDIPDEEMDTRFPIQIVSTGIPFLIAPVRTLAAVQQAKPNWDKFVQLTRGAQPKALLIFCPETLSRENQLHVRVFVDEVGVPEDPATGSANGCLAGYLVQYCYFGKDELNLRVEQGYEIQRPSLLLLRARDNHGTIEVNVGGKVVMVAQGELV